MGFFDAFNYGGNQDQSPTYNAPWSLTDVQRNQVHGAGYSNLGNTLNAVALAPNWQQAAISFAKGMGNQRNAAEEERKRLLDENQKQFNLVQDATHNDIANKQGQLNLDVATEKHLDDKAISDIVTKEADPMFKSMNDMIEANNEMSAQNKAIARIKAAALYHVAQAAPSPEVLQHMTDFMGTLNTTKETDAVFQEATKREQERAAATHGFPDVKTMIDFTTKEHGSTLATQAAQRANLASEAELRDAQIKTAEAKAKALGSLTGGGLAKTFQFYEKAAAPIKSELAFLGKPPDLTYADQQMRVALYKKYGFDFDSTTMQLTEKGVKQYEEAVKNPSDLVVDSIKKGVAAIDLLNPNSSDATEVGVNPASSGQAFDPSKQVDPAIAAKLDHQVLSFPGTDEELKAELIKNGYPMIYIEHAIINRKKR